MSSISDDDNNSSTLSNHTDRLQPVFPDGTAIIWDGNDAHIAGALFECKRFYTRTGLFKSLIEHRAAHLSAKASLPSNTYNPPRSSWAPTLTLATSTTRVLLARSRA